MGGIVLTTSSDLASLGHLPLKGKAYTARAGCLPLQGKVAATQEQTDEVVTPFLHGHHKWCPYDVGANRQAMRDDDLSVSI